MFITFEGIEGSGKTTQIQRLKVELEKRGHPVLCTKEPGGTALGLKIRQFLLDTKTDFQSQYTELLLFYIDRLEHIKQRVEPALEKGITVLCDRYIDSTIAYQVGGRGLKQQLVQTLSDLVNLTPDKTILLDLSPEEGLKRAEKRARLDRFEKESLDFHHRIRNKYLEIAKNNPDRVSLIHVEGLSEDAVANQVRTLL